MDKKILLLYPYYWPHYKAGGPVQSLFNLVNYFKGQALFYLLSRDCDIDGSRPERTITLNRWTVGPNGENIFFSRTISFLLVYKIIREIKPTIILVNGIFNINTTLPGIIWGKFLGIKTVISPRGMLQQWGLERNKYAKKVVLSFLNLILRETECWHATNDQERNEIRMIFGPNQNVSIAPNIPRSPSSDYLKPIFLEKGVKLIFLSLINPNKNLHLIIDAVSRLQGFFTLDIYGPIVNETYWALCKSKILNEDQIVYKGPVPPWDVPKVLPRYHYFILPTQGENFGHAVFDALSCGVPVIITRNTPWKDLDIQQAGFYIDDNEASIHSLLSDIRDMTSSTYQLLRENSFKYAVDYLSASNYKEDYKFLVD